jgi:hypothetical protein
MKYGKLLGVAAAAWLLVAPAMVSAQVVTQSGTLTTSSPFAFSPDFGVPPATVSEGTFYYSALTFTPVQTGPYLFAVNAEFDPALFLYLGAYDPTRPLLNLLFGASIPDPEFPNDPALPFTFSLSGASSYVLVTSTLFEGETGSFTTTVTPIVTAVPEPSTLALTAGALLLVGGWRRRARR